MTLDASGNLGIGTTSPSSKLNVVSSNQDVATFANSNSSTTANNGGALIQIKNTSNTNGNMQSLIFRNSNDTASSGIFGYNAIQSTGEGFLTFCTRNSAGTFGEGMRLDSSGNLLVGTTSTTINSSNFGFKAQSDGQVAFSRNVGSGSAVTQIFGNAGEFRVLGDGNAQNTNNSYGAISDIKLKENITEATPKLLQLNQVRIVNYNLIGSKIKQIGVIAQELETVFPAMVDESPDRDGDGNDLGTTTKSVKYSVFVPMLIKAIQEQQALITQLTARITALETL